MMDLIKAILATAVLTISIVFLLCEWTKADCEDYSVATGRETKFVGGGCYIRHEGNWFTHSEYISLITANGGVSND